jgi:hypothetical protein
MSNQARDSNGRFASGGHGAEAGARDAGRFPVAAHNGQQSVAARTGKLLQAGAATANPAQGRPLRTATAERVAILRGVDQRHRNR